jgi:hypothetical protein
MSPEEFVDVVRHIVVEATARNEVAVLREPPGRSPWPNLVRRSAWFATLDDEDREMVEKVARSAAFGAVFDLFCVLDGVLAFDAARGSLRLTYVDADGHETLLNDREVLELHAELRGDGPPP